MSRAQNSRGAVWTGDGGARSAPLIFPFVLGIGLARSGFAAAFPTPTSVGKGSLLEPAGRPPFGTIP